MSNVSIRYFGVLISLVETNPGLAFMTSGILLTISAQVNSTVDGCLTVTVVSGSPIIVHSFLSNSSGAYTLPIHSASKIIPSSVSAVTTYLELDF